MFQAILCTLAGVALASDPITHSTAAEYALHRIERLVILHRIDPSFQKSFASLEVETLAPQNPGDAAFLIHAFQVSGTDGTRKSIDMNFDLSGRPLTHAL